MASGGTITWSVPLGALALLAFSIMLVEGAIADWSAIYLRTSVLTGPGLAGLTLSGIDCAFVLCAPGNNETVRTRTGKTIQRNLSEYLQTGFIRGYSLLFPPPSDLVAYVTGLGDILNSW